MTDVPPGATGLIENAAPTPVGRVLALSVTGLLKPIWLATLIVYVVLPGAQMLWPVCAISSPKSGASAEQTGRVPQAMPCALNASQMRQAFGVPLARLPSSSSAAR